MLILLDEAGVSASTSFSAISCRSTVLSLVVTSDSSSLQRPDYQPASVGLGRHHAYNMNNEGLLVTGDWRGFVLCLQMKSSSQA